MEHPSLSAPYRVPACARPTVPGLGALPVVVRRAAVEALPADYNGWLAYTADNHTAGYNSFLGFFSVPDEPAERAHIVYLFTGLQNFDWVPKVDPESQGQGFDIIQPVLQYPANFGRGWSVRSWSVFGGSLFFQYCF